MFRAPYVTFNCVNTLLFLKRLAYLTTKLRKLPTYFISYSGEAGKLTDLSLSWRTIYSLYSIVYKVAKTLLTYFFPTKESLIDGFVSVRKYLGLSFLDGINYSF